LIPAIGIRKRSISRRRVRLEIPEYRLSGDGAQGRVVVSAQETLVNFKRQSREVNLACHHGRSSPDEDISSPLGKTR
jgi:hypothetical protein